MFDSTGGTGVALFQNPSIGSGINWWCMEGLNPGCAGTGSFTESLNRSGAAVFVTRQGVVEISTIGALNNLPEPASLALLGLGAMRRKLNV